MLLRVPFPRDPESPRWRTTSLSGELRPCCAPQPRPGICWLRCNWVLGLPVCFWPGKPRIYRHTLSPVRLSPPLPSGRCRWFRSSLTETYGFPSSKPFFMRWWGVPSSWAFPRTHGRLFSLIRIGLSFQNFWELNAWVWNPLELWRLAWLESRP